MPHADRTTRLLDLDDPDEARASARLSAEAFGADDPAPGEQPETPVPPGPGRHTWGTLQDGELVAQLVGREFGSWFCGLEVATCGIADVSVKAEHRGSGLLRDLVAAVLDESVRRGEVVSTLYPTAPGIYRRLGYELIGSYDTVELTTSSLTSVRPAEGITLRRASATDADDVRRLYDMWAAQQNGPLTRRGVSFPADDASLVGASTGVTLAIDTRGTAVGLLRWDRGTGYDATATIAVRDLVALTPDAARALWRVLGSFASVAPQVRLRTSWPDHTVLQLPGDAWRVVGRHPYMLRVLDVAGAFTGLPAFGPAELVFSVEGDPLGVLDGGYLLGVLDSRTTCEPVAADAAALTFTPQGIALAYAGAQSCGNLRMAGHLRGGSPADDVLVDGLLGGRQVHVRDYF